MRAPSALLGAVIALAVVAAIVFVGVSVHEITYADKHPYQYGPAQVIAWAAGAGATLAAAVGALAAAILRANASSRRPGG